MGGRAEQVQVVVKKLFFFSLKLLLKTVYFQYSGKDITQNLGFFD